MRKNIFGLAMFFLAICVATTVGAQEAPQVPYGWTRAESNPNYAFREYAYHTNYGNTWSLQLLDLVSDEMKILSSTSAIDWKPYSDVYDVSAGNNPVVIYQHGGFRYSSRYYSTFIRRISNWDEMLELDTELRSLVFNSDNTATINGEITIDLETLQEVTITPSPLSVTVYEPGYVYEITGQLSNSEFQSTTDTVIDNEGNLYVHQFEDEENILKINTTDGSVTKFATVHTGMDWRPISQMVFDNVNGVMHLVVHYSGADKYLIKITGFKPLLESQTMQSIQDQIDELSRQVNPIFQITNPGHGATINGIVSVDIFSNNEEAIYRCYLMVDNRYIGFDRTSPFSISWDTTSFRNGQHTVKVRGYFRNGVCATKTATITVTTNNAAVQVPSISITSPQGGATVNGTITITTDATRDRFYNVYYFVDGKYIDYTTSAPYEFELDTTTLTDGAHKITVRGYCKHIYKQVFDTIDVNVDNN